MEKGKQMKTNDAIKITNLTKIFKVYEDKNKTVKELFTRGKSTYISKIALNNLNLTIPQGQTVAIVGNNGSGKSTLLKLICEILYPTKGQIEVNGRITSLLSLGAGFHEEFTGLENIYFNGAIFGLNHKQIAAKLDDIIAFSELENSINQPVRTYSAGMIMRLGFAIAINIDADIIIIDEVLAVGDIHFQQKCKNKIKELAEQGKTIIIVSHYLNDVLKLCQRTIWLDKGQIVMDGETKLVLANYKKSEHV